MKEENPFPSIKSPSTLGELDSPQLGEDAVESRWHNVIKRRSFLKNISLAGATVTASGLNRNTTQRPNQGKFASSLTG